MYNPDDIQNDTNRSFEKNNEGLGGNLVPEGNMNFEGEGEQGENQFQQSFPREQNQHASNDNSFNIGRKIDDFSRSENFMKKEKAISDQLDQILKGKSSFSISKLSKYIFGINKILFLTTFIEFLFQRFDIVSLFLCIAVIFIELEIFTHKHLYKWLIVLLSSILLDALVLIDISPVSIYIIFILY